MADIPTTGTVPSEAPAPTVISNEENERKTVNPEGDKLAQNCPPISRMINEAIVTLNEKEGSSLQAIKKFIAANYEVDIGKLDPYLKRALKKGVESGNLINLRSVGTSGAFKPNSTRKLAGEEKQKAKEENVAAYPREQKGTKEVKPNAVTMKVAPKKATAVASTPNKAAPNPDGATSTELEKAPVEEKSSVVMSSQTLGLKSAEEGEADARPDPNGFLNLLKIDLVMEAILRNLNLYQMNDLSLVSKDTFFAVQNSKAFSDRGRFRICEFSIRSRVLDKCFHSWKSVKLDLILDAFRIAESLPDSSTISKSLNCLQSFLVNVRSSKDVANSVQRKVNDFILEIIESSTETLEDLKLFLFHPHGLDGIEWIRCPNLKRLTLVTRNIEMEDLEIIRLLQNLPPLEELSTRGIDSSDIVTGLRGQMSKLRKLNIDITILISTGRRWETFANMTSLEDIRITVTSECPKSELTRVLGNIPTQKVTKISLEDYGASRFRSSPQNIGECLNRYTNLTELSLKSLRNFDDIGLQGVIKSCPKLAKLALDGLPKVTEVGISGVKIGPVAALNEPGVSLSHLRELTTLQISHCGCITVATLFHAIRFELLTSLNFFNAVEGSKALTARAFLLQLLEQNPNLERVALGVRNADDPYSRRDYALEDEAKRCFPRIRELEFEYGPESFLTIGHR